MFLIDNCDSNTVSIVVMVFATNELYAWHQFFFMNLRSILTTFLDSTGRPATKRSKFKE